MKTKIKNLISSETFFIIVLFSLFSFISFFLGRLSIKYENQLHKQNYEIKVIKNNSQKKAGVIASKKGKTYHLPWCPGATSMTQKNKIYFNSIAEAEAAGYKAAKNCEGL